MCSGRRRVVRRRNDRRMTVRGKEIQMEMVKCEHGMRQALLIVVAAQCDASSMAALMPSRIS
jgi:hypothetical protein